MMTQKQDQIIAPQIDFGTEEESHVAKKFRDSPLLPVATVAFLGLGAYRIYKSGNRGGEKLSFYLIHTRLAAQGLAVACLGGMVFYSLGQRLFSSKNSTSDK